MGLFRKKPKDEFKALSKQRRAVEDEQPWFVGDDDAPDLDVQTGIGSNLHRDRPDDERA